MESASGALVLGVGGALGLKGRACADGGPPEQFRVLGRDEAALYDAWCDVLVPGAAAAGVSLYLDKQLAAPHPDSLLFLRVLANPPFDGFYRGGIEGVDEESTARFREPFLALPDLKRREIVDAAATTSTIAWTEPDPSFFYFVSRADAIDVVWGTLRGFQELKISYMAHIRPSEPW